MGVFEHKALSFYTYCYNTFFMGGWFNCSRFITFF